MLTPRSQRPLLNEQNQHLARYNSWRHRRRRAILKETVEQLTERYDELHRRAAQNLERWRGEREARGEALPQGRVEVRQGDWGDVTQALTQRWGLCFPVLNMANAYVAGGAYLQGTAAQEENMFRRTDCHLALKEEELQPHNPLDPSYIRYRPELTELIKGIGGRVSLDLERPRVCVRGSERRQGDDFGYPWLPDQDIFPFYELKAAACDLRDGSPFDPVECARRFTALLDTLKERGQRVAVLGAHGCGAFENPAERVAEIYERALAERRADFDLITFAIYDGGYGPNNYLPFAERFSGW